jgi:uncharacterized protein YndB with AHSA1/START domain
VGALPEPPGATSLVEREIRIEADPETVFPFFTDPEKIARWVGVGATLDPRAGGVFCLDTAAGYSFVGEYVQVEPYSRLVFTWGYGNFQDESNPLPPGSSTVEVELVPDGEATIVRLSHRVPVDLADFHAFGWEVSLPRLAIVATGGDPGPDPFGEVLASLTEDD